MKWHFWYSHQQKTIQDHNSGSKKGVVRNSYATVNSREVIYTDRSRKRNYGGKFKDVLYLGLGEFGRVEDVRVFPKAIIKNRSSKIKKVLVKVEVDEIGDEFQINVEILGRKIVKNCITKERLSFEKNRISRLKNLIEGHPKSANYLIREYKNS